MDPIILTLPDMTCGHCVKSVTRTVMDLDPAAQVQTDLATHRVTLHTAVARDVLEKALAAAGYPRRPEPRGPALTRNGGAGGVA